MFSLSAIYQRFVPILVAWQILATMLGFGLHALPGNRHHACEDTACHSGAHHGEETVVRDVAHSVAHQQADCAICKWLTQAKSGLRSSVPVSQPVLLGRDLAVDFADVARITSRLVLPRAPPA